MDQPDYAYIAGRLIGGPIIVFLLGYGLVRLIKKRAPTKKEIIIIALVAVVLGVLSLVVSTAKTVAY